MNVGVGFCLHLFADCLEGPFRWRAWHVSQHTFSSFTRMTRASCSGLVPWLGASGFRDGGRHTKLGAPAAEYGEPFK